MWEITPRGGKLEGIITSEEEHIDWIETQMETIKQVGLENFSANICTKNKSGNLVIN